MPMLPPRPCGPLRIQLPFSGSAPASSSSPSFDLAGGLTFDDDMALIEGGEIKSSAYRMFLRVIAHSSANSLIAEFAAAEEQLFRRFVLLHAYVNILFPNIKRFKAMGFVYALRMGKDRGIKDITKLNYMPEEGKD